MYKVTEGLSPNKYRREGERLKKRVREKLREEEREKERKRGKEREVEKEKGREGWGREGYPQKHTNYVHSAKTHIIMLLQNCSYMTHIQTLEMAAMTSVLISGHNDIMGEFPTFQACTLVLIHMSSKLCMYMPMLYVYMTFACSLCTYTQGNGMLVTLLRSC